MIVDPGSITQTAWTPNTTGIPSKESLKQACFLKHCLLTCFTSLYPPYEENRLTCLFLPTHFTYCGHLLSGLLHTLSCTPQKTRRVLVFHPYPKIFVRHRTTCIKESVCFTPYSSKSQVVVRLLLIPIMSSLKMSGVLLLLLAHDDNCHLYLKIFFLPDIYPKSWRAIIFNLI